MNSSEIEQKLAKIFIYLAKGERKVEISRQVLCESEDCNVFQLFKLLDKENKNYIDCKSIMNFLISKEISVNNNEVQLLILFYDQNYDKVLSLNEFKNLIKSQNNFYESHNTNNIKNININFNVNYSFTKLLEKELELCKKILLLLDDIRKSKNFNIHELYHKVKISNFIDEEGIKNFLSNNHESFLDSDIKSILKRLDLNKDGKVDLCEFHAFLGFPNCYYCCPCIACCHCGTCYCKICFCSCNCIYHKRKHRSYNSPSKNNKGIKKYSDYGKDYEINSKEISNNNNYINNDFYLNNNINNNNFNNNYMINENENIKFEGLSMKTKKILDNNYQPNLKEVNKNNYNDEKEEIIPINCLKNNNINLDLKNSEINLDLKKISKSLTIRPSPERKHFPRQKALYYPRNDLINNDYNLLLNKNNSSTYKDQNQTKNEENNNFKSYNENKENQIGNDNSKIYTMENSKENKINDSQFDNKDEYEENQFKEFIKHMMLAEGQIEKIKVKLALCHDFNCEDCFRIFEIDEKGVLYPEDIKSGLKLINVFYSDFEIKLLIKRFDLQKRGYINYSDFFDIFIPFEREYRTIVEERKPNSCCPCRCPDIFCPETLSLLKNLMDAVIKHENNLNFLRRGFTTLNLKLENIFGNIDIMKMGYFTNNDLTLYLKKNNIYTNSLEADLLFIRLDKNRNGKIDYKEIYDETHPLYNLN